VPTRKQVVWGAVLVVVLVALLVAALVFGPPWFVPDGNLGASDRARLVAEGSLRTTILQLVAGVVVVLGLAYTALQVGISRETHYTDRYTKAIDQLGHEKAIVRVGGIHALKRLASNSTADRPMVMDVLGGYLRTESPAPTASKPPPSTAKAKLAPDIQTALTVLIGLHADEAKA
jgi:hypothetical protein